MASALRRTIRSLARSPGYTASAIVSIAVGLALATATFAFVDAILHPVPPYADAGQLYITDLRFGNQKNPPSTGDQLRALRALRQVEGATAKWSSREGSVAASNARNRSVAVTSANYWSVLGVTPHLGHLPTPREAESGRVALVSDDFWRTEHEGATSLDGATVRVGQTTYDIIAVLPTRVTENYGGAVWLPRPETRALDSLRVSSYMRSATIYVRLRPGEDAQTVAPETQRIAAAFTRDYVSTVSGAPPYWLTLRSMIVRPPQASALEILFIVVAVGILAIGCTNVAALSLARGLTRRRDYALRMALGASRQTIGADVITEVAVLAAVGAMLGFGATYGLLGVFAHLIPQELTWRWIEPPVMNPRVFMFSAFAAVVAIALAASVPALRATRIAPNDSLKDGAGTTTGRARGEFRALVIGELAIAMVLMMMANLMSVSAKNILSYDFGMDVHHVLMVGVGLPGGGGPGDAAPKALRVVGERALEIVRSTPGVLSASTLTAGTSPTGFEISSDRSSAGEPVLQVRYVKATGTGGLIETFGAKILAGRDFADGDVQGDGAAILSQRAAKALFPRGDAVGRRIKLGTPDSPRSWIPVVGVSNDFYQSIASDPTTRDPEVWVARRDTLPRYWQLAARFAGDPKPVIVALQRRLRDNMPSQALTSVSRMTENTEASYRFAQFFARIFGALGTAAIMLAALGLFSVLSYVVSQRSREFAVRVALGASEANIVRVVMRSALEFALGGTAIGALLSFWASAALTDALYGIKNTDPATLVLTEALLVAITLVAALAPALRASRANPLDVIRAA